MSKIEKVLFTGKTHTTPAAGNVRRAHGKLDIQLSPGRDAVPEHVFTSIESHPTAEQLFAGAWSACYIAAIGLAAQQRKIALPDGLAVDIEVDLGQSGAEYFLQARLNVTLPGIAHEQATELAHAADAICPYSKAVRGNIDVAINVVTA